MSGKSGNVRNGNSAKSTVSRTKGRRDPIQALFAQFLRSRGLGGSNPRLNEWIILLCYVTLLWTILFHFGWKFSLSSFNPHGSRLSFFLSFVLAFLLACWLSCLLARVLYLCISTLFSCWIAFLISLFLACLLSFGHPFRARFWDPKQAQNKKRHNFKIPKKKKKHKFRWMMSVKIRHGSFSCLLFWKQRKEVARAGTKGSNPGAFQKTPGLDALGSFFCWLFVFADGEGRMSRMLRMLRMSRMLGGSVSEGNTEKSNNVENLKK